MVLKKLVTLAVPVSIALAAFLHAHAIGSLIEASTLPSVDSLKAARGATSPDPRLLSSLHGDNKSADKILDRNVFDHVTGSLRPTDALATSGTTGGEGYDDSDPMSAPQCDGVRAIATMSARDVDASFAAFDVSGKRILQKRGGDIDDNVRVVFVAADRVWLRKNNSLCQARVFGAQPMIASPPSTQSSATPAGQQSPLEKEVAQKIVKTGPNEYQVDRGAVNMILEAQTELMKTPLVPEKQGDRVIGFRLMRIKPGTVLATLGLESNDVLVSLNNIEVTSTEKMMEAYAKLKMGTFDRFTIGIIRNGKPTNLDYVIH